MNKIKIIKAKQADILEQKVNDFYKEYELIHTAFLTRGKELIAIISYRDTNIQEKCFEEGMREARCNQDHNYHMFQELEEKIYKIKDRVEELENKKQKQTQSKILHS